MAYLFRLGWRRRRGRGNRELSLMRTHMLRNQMRPVHPGEVLREDFMLPLGLSANALARALAVTPARINDIVRQRRSITGDTALRLARYFRTDAQSWLNLQSQYDLRVAEMSGIKEIRRLVKPRAA